MDGERLHRSARWIARGTSAALVPLLSLTFATCGGGQTTQPPPPPGAQFIVEAVPLTPLMTPGSSFSTTIIAIPLIGGSWNGVIAVTMSGLPSGLTANPQSFSVDTTKGNGNVPVTFSAAVSLSTGVYPFTVTGTSGSISYSITMAVGVVEPPPQATPLPAKVLYSFSGQQDGGGPGGALVSDSAGNLYGTTDQGGAYGPGTVFELSFSNGAWQETVLHSFGNGTDGAGPLGSLVFDASGNLYGATRLGGTGACSEGCGTVYELTPLGSGWQETVLHNFTGGADGFNPAAGVVLDNAGNLYGTTEYGGAVLGNAYCSTVGCGTVFTLKTSGNGWAYSVIHSFQGPPDGNDPGGGGGGGLIFDQQGNLYGTTYSGGNVNCPEGNPYSGGGGCGIVFEMTSSGSAWQETVLHSFQATYDGLRPSGLVLDSGGNLFGTTYGGFSDPLCNNDDSCGNFFELTPTGNGWALNELYYFWGSNLGYQPSGLVRDQAGNFYGVASGGPPGCDFNLGCGTVFQLSKTGQGWVESANYEFPGGAAGWWPRSVTLSGGNLYGTTVQGGGSNYGVIFEISP
jgi:uncharacterized repeat protein (TIGR03803 family)